MENSTIRIYDTSLRDGLRNSGIAIGLDDKVRFLQQLEALGVSDVEVGFGGPSQVETMERLAEAVEQPVLYGLSRVNRRDVDRVITSLARANHRGINIFSPTSEEFLGHGKTTAGEALEASVKAIRHARDQLGDPMGDQIGDGAGKVVFSAQDATKSELAYLIEIIAAVIEAGADVISLADTRSLAMPREFGDLCAALRAKVPGGQDVLWSVHCHNGLGLAVANCAAGIENGVRQVECTVNGIGEIGSNTTGSNTTMQAVVELLQRRADAFPGLNTAIKYGVIPDTEHMLRDISQRTDEASSGTIELLQRDAPK
ncbi:MAG: hypothetical protein HOK21_04070 [Rhodospirillaceae bacterium]|jgi:2-isopropylmalate synthase|nr:hypothetical protein [Rhodospirillaceae bacterium]MBT4042815.1 hypothetical protein [Rhodospirillaceae bacterium]MBT4689239.1 hypothetical protein [Rhodospirillaceae bacterium]MBT5080434.1 hypothetical protein [Rhodospirillaceae bacterium]MBT5523238.1 hypothetical protein [Rhodospirillaceae bacterium]